MSDNYLMRLTGFESRKQDVRLGAQVNLMTLVFINQSRVDYPDSFATCNSRLR